MFWERLDRWRGRSEAERRRLALWLSLILTVLLAGFWLLNLRYLWQNEPVPVAPTANPPSAGSFWLDNLDRIKQGWQKIIE